MMVFQDPMMALASDLMGVSRCRRAYCTTQHWGCRDRVMATAGP